MAGIDQAQRREAGFTLIELLVVVIIIGVLATIAIPVFLEQRAGARQSAVQSDLRNASIAQQTYSVANDTYTTDLSELRAEGFDDSSHVSLTIPSADSDGYCMEASHNASGRTWYFSSANGQPLEGTCP